MNNLAFRSILIGDDMFLSRVPLLNKLNAKSFYLLKRLLGDYQKVTERTTSIKSLPCRLSMGRCRTWKRRWV
jgi:hypothetical protein